jgi:zinc D-Ala-D-Ala dipeptidase
MHSDFVRLEKILPEIEFSLRLAGVNNFMAKVADGYKTSDRVIITKQAAEQLVKVQNRVMQDGYVLAVYDAYRPVKAVQDFIRWNSDLNEANKKIFYPFLTKKEIFARGFIAERSQHSRGSTIDLTLIEKGSQLLNDPVFSLRKLKSGREIPFYDDNSLDMGSSFDLFDEVSFNDNREITKDQFDRRMYLRDVMVQYGFEPYEKEWWHFCLKNEPFPNTYFDFDIKK